MAKSPAPGAGAAQLRPVPAGTARMAPPPIRWGGQSAPGAATAKSAQAAPPPPAVHWPGASPAQAKSAPQARPGAMTGGRSAVVQRWASDDEDYEYTSDDEEDDYSSGAPNIPYGTNQHIKKKVAGVDYEFQYRKDGTIDFMKPVGNSPACPHAVGTWDVDIIDPKTDTLKFTGKVVKSGRSAHFYVANMIREGKKQGQVPVNGSKSPVGFTWHHHRDRGRLQLIDRKVHAAFPHAGGESIWGGIA